MMTTNRLHVSPLCFSHLKNALQRSHCKSTRTSSFLSTSEQYSLMWTCHTSDLFSVLLMDFWVFSSVLRFKVVFLYQEISLCKSFSYLLLVYFWHQNPKSGNCSINEQICIHYFQILPNSPPQCCTICMSNDIVGEWLFSFFQSHHRECYLLDLCQSHS